MNVALIFAGGTGQRMNTKTMPKQFLELHGKPIIVYTMEQFENHPEIDGIVAVCIEEWIPYLQKLIGKFGLKKVCGIVSGGTSGQESIFHGVEYIHNHFEENCAVLVHDGVRPLVDQETISQNIRCVHAKGSSVTTVPAIETIVVDGDENSFGTIVDRSRCCMARAPQCFFADELYNAHMKARAEGRNDFIDSAQLMYWYGIKLHKVLGKPENIKITTPVDYYIFRAIIDAKESSQIFGL